MEAAAGYPVNVGIRAAVFCKMLGCSNVFLWGKQIV